MDKLDSYHLPVTGRNILRFAFPTIVTTTIYTDNHKVRTAKCNCITFMQPCFVAEQFVYIHNFFAFFNIVFRQFICKNFKVYFYTPQFFFFTIYFKIFDHLKSFNITQVIIIIKIFVFYVSHIVANLHIF